MKKIIIILVTIFFTTGVHAHFINFFKENLL